MHRQTIVAYVNSRNWSIQIEGAADPADRWLGRLAERRQGHQVGPRKLALGVDGKGALQRHLGLVVTLLHDQTGSEIAPRLREAVAQGDDLAKGLFGLLLRLGGHLLHPTLK